MIGYKKAHVYLNGRRKDVIITLHIPKNAFVVEPNEEQQDTNPKKKHRSSKAKVLNIQFMNNKQVPRGTRVFSHREPCFIYKRGKTVVPDGFNHERYLACGAGIHFFAVRQEAVNYDWK